MVDTEGLPLRIHTIFQLFLKNPSALSHMIIVGPPGSGKTTSARAFVEKLHGQSGFNSFFGRALFLNSSDERGLEAVRSRVFPFVRSSLHSILGTKSTLGYTPPKVIIFDEAETLTDQAQIALRPLLDTNPQEILLIFLCNSVSRIHASILHKFMTIQLEAPSATEFQKRLEKIETKETPTAGIDILYRRGDIRYFLLHPTKHTECAKLWTSIFSTPSYKLEELIETLLKTWIYPELAMFFLVIAKELQLLTPSALYNMLRITDGDFLRMCPPDIRTHLLSKWIEENLHLKLDEPIRQG
jgi:GTPase SAR1 family protein